MAIDIILAILVASSFYLGYSRGIIKTIFGILSIIIGILATLKLSPLMINFLKGFMDIDPRLIIIIGFVATFLIFLIGVRMIGKGLEKILEAGQINIINQILGGIASALITLVMYSTVIWALSSIKMFKPGIEQKSISYSYLITIPEKSKHILEKTKPMFNGFWKEISEVMRGVDESQQKPVEQAPQ